MTDLSTVKLFGYWHSMHKPERKERGDMPIKAYKYRLYPNKETEQQLSWVLARCCELYNAALQERREAWKYAGKSISYPEQSSELTEIKAEMRTEYQDIGSHVLQDVLKRLDKAFQAFFRRVKAGQTPGYPRFKSRDRYDSFTYPDSAGWKLEGKKLHLTKIGTVKVKLHREVQGQMKTCTIKREGAHWYVIFACEVDLVPRLAYSDEMVGIDLGTMLLATLSTGDTIENPRHYRCAEKKLAVKQQALKHKKQRSKRRKKAAKQVGKLHRKVANQRKDFLHKQARILVDTYDTLVFEDLSPSNLSRRPKRRLDEETGQYLPNGASAKSGLNKSIQDAGWTMFQQLCACKAAEAGRQVLFVNPHKTSQICSACGEEGPHKDLSERVHICIHCGVVLDRDLNAALNILKLGRQLLEEQRHAALGRSARRTRRREATGL
jgi:putative transposase